MTYFRDLVPITTVLPDPDPFGRAQEQLVVGDVLFSATMAFQLILTAEGNLELHRIDDSTLPLNITEGSYQSAFWESGTGGRGVIYCRMQTDGNLALINTFGEAVWTSDTPGNPGAFLRCQDDGNLVVYGPPADGDEIVPFNPPLWASNTYAGTENRKSSF
jgi:hypothetical protein